MSQTLEHPLAADKAAFLESVERFQRALANTPDDRLNWSPTPTARTPIQIAAHVAEALGHIRNMIVGSPFQIEDTVEADAFFRDNERKFGDRASVVESIEKCAAAFVDTLDGYGESELDEPMTLPFRLGSAPRRIGYQVGKMHTDSHTPQLEYIQTCYGDRDWHMDA